MERTASGPVAREPWDYPRCYFREAQEHFDRHESPAAALTAGNVPATLAAQWLKQWSHYPPMIVAKYHKWVNAMRELETKTSEDLL